LRITGHGFELPGYFGKERRFFSIAQGKIEPFILFILNKKTSGIVTNDQRTSRKYPERPGKGLQSP
jgi:hypothetical protein